MLQCLIKRVKAKKFGERWQFWAVLWAAVSSKLHILSIPMNLIIPKENLGTLMKADIPRF